MINVIGKSVGKVEKLSKVCGHMAGGMLTVCLIIIVAGIIARTSGMPIRWTTQFANYMMMGSILLGFSYAMLIGDHIHTDIILRLFKGRVRRWFLASFRIVGLLWAVFFCIGCWLYWYSNMKAGAVDWSSINVPLWIPQLVLSLGGTFLLMQTLATIIGEGLGLRVSTDEGKITE